MCSLLESFHTMIGSDASKDIVKIYEIKELLDFVLGVTFFSHDKNNEIA